MKIIQKVIVKHVLTEKSKHTLKEKFLNKRKQAYKEYEQLLFEYKKFEKKRGKADSGKVQGLQKELDLRKDKIEQVNFQLQQLDLLPIGFELKENEVESIVDVQVGDNWNTLMGRTIILKDGIVNEIR